MAAPPPFTGTPGETWTNDTGFVRWQFHCSWVNTCAVCAQYDGMIASGPWPIPYHVSCRCDQSPLFPGDESQPFTDFLAHARSLPPGERAKLVGAAAWKLIEKGVAAVEDFVKSDRVATLAEVVAAKKLTEKALVKAGVSKPVAAAAVGRAKGKTPEAVAAGAFASLLKAVKDKVTNNKLFKRVFGPKAPPAPAAPAAATKRLTPAELARSLGVKLKGVARSLGLVKPEPDAFGIKFVRTPAAEEVKAPAVVLDVAKADAAWKRDKNYYIPPGGGSDKQKYLNAVAFVKKAVAEGITVDMGRVTVDADGVLSFVDGRHRFAALRDLGAGSVPLTVDPADAKRAAKLLGAE